MHNYTKSKIRRQVERKYRELLDIKINRYMFIEFQNYLLYIFYPINLLLYSFVRRYSPENHHFITLIQGNEGVLAVILIVQTLSCGLLPAHHHIRNLLECSSRKYFIVLLIRTLNNLPLLGFCGWRYRHFPSVFVGLENKLK